MPVKFNLVSYKLISNYFWNVLDVVIFFQLLSLTIIAKGHANLTIFVSQTQGCVGSCILASESSLLKV